MAGTVSAKMQSDGSGRDGYIVRDSLFTKGQNSSTRTSHYAASGSTAPQVGFEKGLRDYALSYSYKDHYNRYPRPRSTGPTGNRKYAPKCVFAPPPTEKVINGEGSDAWAALTRWEATVSRHPMLSPSYAGTSSTSTTPRRTTGRTHLLGRGFESFIIC